MALLVEKAPLAAEQARFLREKLAKMPRYVPLKIEPGSPEWPKDIEASSVIPDLLIVRHKVFDDNRGPTEVPFVFSQIERVLGHEFKIAQPTRSANREALTGRGLHAAPYLKLTECLQGQVCVVIVDCRENSPSFLRVATIKIGSSEGEKEGVGLVIPSTCAHAYVTLTAGAKYQYHATGEWTSDAEVGFNLLDPHVTAQLNEPPKILSPKDIQNPFFSEIFPEHFLR